MNQKRSTAHQILQFRIQNTVSGTVIGNLSYHPFACGNGSDVVNINSSVGIGRLTLTTPEQCRKLAKWLNDAALAMNERQR